jgi:methylated-DNA-[protein]-cysteine S-methyltransferase
MPETICFQLYSSPVGMLKIADFNEKLCMCDWLYRTQRSRIDQRISAGLKADFVESDTDLLSETRKQLEEYFSGNRKAFTLPLQWVGSDFQQRVWQALMEIPYGKTMTYKGLTEKLGNPDTIRAVASANGANAISIIVPCHRVIGSNGELIGYAGGLPAKKRLLQLEKAIPENWELFDEK